MGNWIQVASKLKTNWECVGNLKSQMPWWSAEAGCKASARNCRCAMLDRLAEADPQKQSLEATQKSPDDLIDPGKSSHGAWCVYCNRWLSFHVKVQHGGVCKTRRATNTSSTRDPHD